MFFWEHLLIAFRYWLIKHGSEEICVIFLKTIMCFIQFLTVGVLGKMQGDLKPGAACLVCSDILQFMLAGKEW